MLISQMFEKYKKDKELEGYSPHTLKAYKIQSNLLIRYFGDIEFEDMTIDMLKDYIASQIEKLKPSSIGHRVKFLKSINRWAFELGYIKINPAYPLKEPKQGHRVPKCLSEEDIEMIRDNCKDSLERSLMELLYATGCRIGEIYKLNRSDINFNHKSIIVDGKGSKEREVFFNTKCEIWLKKYFKDRKDDIDALFSTVRKPYRRMSIDQMRYVLKRVVKRIDGIEKSVYPHRFRHTYAIHLLENQCPLEIIGDLMGHFKLESTKIYTQLSTERRRGLYQRYFK